MASSQGRSEGDHTLCQSEGSHQIVMSFLPPLVGCLLKTSLQKGVGGSRALQDPPWPRPCNCFVGMLMKVLLIPGLARLP